MKLNEIADHEPLLVRIVKQQLAKGTEIWADIKIPFLSGMQGHFTHEGPVVGIRIMHQSETTIDLKRIAKGDSCVLLTILAKSNKWKKRDIMLNVATFDDTYELRPHDEHDLVLGNVS